MELSGRLTGQDCLHLEKPTAADASDALAMIRAWRTGAGYGNRSLALAVRILRKWALPRTS